MLLTGFLGSGKTTLLNRMLADGAIADRRAAILINEFGSLNIDAALVRSGHIPKFEINRGSLMCTCTRDTMLAALDRIAAARPQLLLIEATGLAHGAELEALLAQASTALTHFEMRSNVCLVDAQRFLRTAASWPAAARQVAAADAIVLNKIDLAPPPELQQLHAVLRRMNPDATIEPCSHGGVGCDFWRRLAATPHRAAASAIATAPPAEVTCASLRTDKAVNRERLEAVLARYGQRILRLKGIVDFGKGPVLVQQCGGEMTTEPAPPGAAATAITVIAWQADKLELLTELEQATESHAP
jgi:G3E family GTPase